MHPFKPLESRGGREVVRTECRKSAKLLSMGRWNSCFPTEQHQCSFLEHMQHSKV